MDTDARRADQEAPRPAVMCLFMACYFLAAMGVFMLWFLLIWLLWSGITYKEPNHSLAIAAVSGLGPATDLGGRPPAVLDPEFDLTVVVAPRSSLIHACGEPGAAVRVSYHGFELASATVPKFCEVRGTLTVVARGRGVRLPEPALDSLAADVRRAAGVFDVTITVPHTEYHRGATHLTHELVISCMGRLVGEDAGGAAFCLVRTVE